MVTHRGARTTRSLRILSPAVVVWMFLVAAANTTTASGGSGLAARAAGPAEIPPGAEVQGEGRSPLFPPIDPNTVIDPAKVRGADRGSVWDFVFTAEQAARGQAAYRQKCEQCHRADLQGDSVSPGLAGPMFHFRWDESPLSAWFVEVRDSMPQEAPGSLSDQALVDILAYVLKENGFPAGKTELPADEDVLQRIFIDEVPLPKK